MIPWNAVLPLSMGTEFSMIPWNQDEESNGMVG